MAHVFSGDFSSLEGEARKKALPAGEILKEAGIKKGDTVIDFGCGIGYFSIPVSEIVGGGGKVFAIDRSDRMINEIKKRTSGINNIEIIKSDTLSDIKGDVILLITVLHEVDDQEDFLKQCFSSLNAGGKLIIIDWQKKETPMGPPLSHRISKEDTLSMAGHEAIEHAINDNFYFLEFTKGQI